MSPIRKCPDAFSETQIDDEHVLMVLETGEFVSLAGTAGAIWRLIDRERSREEILERLAEDFAADRALIASDLEAFVADLEKRGLVVEG